MLALMGALSISLASCQMASLDQIAPLPTSSSNSTLARGRDIYITKCAKCHSPEPVARYSKTRWHEIMPEMVEETNLNAEDAAAVMAYVLAIAQ